MSICSYQNGYIVYWMTVTGEVTNAIGRKQDFDLRQKWA
jgi:hypothetical protein